MITYPVADMLTRLVNAGRAGKPEVDIYYSRYLLNILHVMKREGFVKNVKVFRDNNKNIIKVFLKYTDAGKHVISGVKIFSRPGKRIYSGHRKFPRVLSGIATVIISTSRGVMTDREARKNKVGGEVIFGLW